VKLGAAKRAGRLLLLAVLFSVADVACVTAEAVFPDRIVARGDTLRGRVSRFTADHIEISTRYGKGVIEVPFDSIQAVFLIGDYVVLHGESDEVRGPIAGLVGDTLLVRVAPDSVFALELSRIRSAIALEDFGDSWLDRMRRRWRYWSGGLDIGWALEDGALIERKIDSRVHLERRREPTRFLADHEQKFETRQNAGETEPSTTKDEFRSLLLVEYDLTNRYYVYSTPGAERDRPRKIELRAYPNAGVGRRFVDTEGLLLQTGVGLAYVWEEFIGLPDNQYFGLHVTGEYRWRTRLGPVVSGRINYTPAMSSGNEWLFRSEFRLDFPIIELMSLRYSITNVSDNNPSPEVGNNKITTSLMMALKFP
jgi:hypothetical protein